MYLERILEVLKFVSELRANVLRKILDVFIMAWIDNIYFHYEEGELFTITGTSSNPGYTKLPQYWIVIKLRDGGEVYINLKSDFKDIFGGTKITESRREAIGNLVKRKRNLLIGLEVSVKNKNYRFALETHWQKRKGRKYEEMPYVGLDDNSLKKIREVLEKPMKQILQANKKQMEELSLLHLSKDG